MSDPWLDMGPTTIQADGEDEILFMAKIISATGSLRVARRRRPWQYGQKIDETGDEGDELTIEGIFHNDMEEAGLEGVVQWPDNLEALWTQLKTGKTVTLNFPWKRGLRVKPITRDRRASSDEVRGGEVVTVKFHEDNEDALDREAVEKVSVKAAANRAVEEATFSMESEGMSADLVNPPVRSFTELEFSDPVSTINGLASDVVGLLSAPQDFADALALAATRLRRATLLLLEAFDSPEEGRDQMGSPQGAAARQKLLALLDLAARASDEALEHLPKRTTYPVERNTDIWAIATEVGQPVRDLMSINDGIEDFAVIRRGTRVVIFAE